MKRFSGIGGKIFGSFIVLVLTGLAVGGIGYVTLDRVIVAGHQERLANDVEASLFEARQQEKNVIIRRDQESFTKLNNVLDLLATQAQDMKSLVSDAARAEEIKEAQAIYKQKATELKRLLEDDAVALKALQETAARIMSSAEEQSNKAVVEEKERILKSSAANMKENALKRIREVVAVGHDVLKFYHQNGMPQDKALDLIRGLHFEGNNYYFAVDEKLTLIAHGSDRKLEGMDFGKIQDKKTGKTFMKEIVASAVKDGESFTDYYWTKPGMGDAVFPKITYAKYFKPWGLILCAGAYTDDVDQEISKMSTLLQDGFSKLNQANAISDIVAKARLNALYYFAFEQNAEKVGEAIAELKGSPFATDDLKKQADAYLDDFNRRVKNNQDRNQAIAQIISVARKAQESAKEVSRGAEEGALRTAMRGKTLMIIFVLAGAFAGLVLAVFLVRAITKPLKAVIEGLSEGSEQVASASSQVAASSHQLAEGSSEQAASLEETSSSLEEMASMTRQNAGNASQARQSMKLVEGTVKEVDEHLREMTEAMDKIRKSSEQTIRIVKTIDEIAFQTNLLALNAAVEAARAGEAGAGFAVVADEVRSLALRAAEAARETGSLIENTIQAVRHGNELTGMTQQAFQKNMEISAEVATLVDEISAASHEQAQGVEQVNRAVSEMDRLTQQNAANAEQSAAASQEMNAQAEQMKNFVRDLLSLVEGKKGGVEGQKAPALLESKG